jgi:hypothetical protein
MFHALIAIWIFLATYSTFCDTIIAGFHYLDAQHQQLVLEVIPIFFLESVTRFSSCYVHPLFSTLFSSCSWDYGCSFPDQHQLLC